MKLNTYTLESGKTLYLRKLKGRKVFKILPMFSPLFTAFGTFLDTREGEAKEVMFSSLGNNLSYALETHPEVFEKLYDILAQDLCKEDGTRYSQEGLEDLLDMIDDTEEILSILIWLIKTQLKEPLFHSFKNQFGISAEQLTEALGFIKNDSVDGEEGQ